MATKSTKTTKTTKATVAKSAKSSSKKSASKATKNTEKVPAIERIQPIIPHSYKPVSAFGYIGWEIVYSIPVIGLIICICQAFCAENVNLRSFARSQFVWLFLIVVGLCILAGLGILQVAIENTINYGPFGIFR